MHREALGLFNNIRKPFRKWKGFFVWDYHVFTTEARRHRGSSVSLRIFLAFVEIYRALRNIWFVKICDNLRNQRGM